MEHIDIKQFVSGYPPIKRSWVTQDDRHFFETGEFIMVMNDGQMLQVKNAVFEFPSDSYEMRDMFEIDGTKCTVTMASARLVSIEYKE